MKLQAKHDYRNDFKQLYSIREAIESVAEVSTHERGALEEMQAQIQQLAKALGMLIDELHYKGALEDQQVALIANVHDYKTFTVVDDE